jgi:hypothetical protein
LAISATLAPSRAARSAISRPMPRLPPEMNKVLPVSVIERPSFWDYAGQHRSPFGSSKFIFPNGCGVSSASA